MREIKFRGKRIDDNEWIYGYLLYDYDMADDYVPFIIWKDERYLGGSGEEQIIEHTIGQYTGIKDKNGKEIYEGDIVKAKFFEKHITGKIEFALGAFFVTGSAVSDNQMFIFNDFEVIGNIYDNPKLLKGEQS